MSESNKGYHEPIETLSEETRDIHRALVSFQEELEAVDWYRQRADACLDPDLKKILLHNMEEEVEHAMMMLEWLRRRNSGFEEMLARYVKTEPESPKPEGSDLGLGSSRGGR